MLGEGGSHFCTSRIMNLTAKMKTKICHFVLLMCRLERSTALAQSLRLKFSRHRKKRPYRWKSWVVECAHVLRSAAKWKFGQYKPTERKTGLVFRHAFFTSTRLSVEDGGWEQFCCNAYESNCSIVFTWISNTHLANRYNHWFTSVHRYHFCCQEWSQEFC